MPESPAPPPTLINEPVSIVRLHGEACFHCGAVTKALHAAGHVTLPGKGRVWPIFTCGCRTPAVTPMNAATRARLPWIPAAGTVWHVEAGTHFDAVRVSRSIGLQAQERLGDACGAVICDPWTRIHYFLTEAGSTAGWDERDSTPCSSATYVVVPSLSAHENVLHWTVPPTPDRSLTDLAVLRTALRATLQAAYGPRTERLT